MSGVREQEKSSHLENRVLSDNCTQQGYSVARKQVKFRLDKGSQQGYRVASRQMKFNHEENWVQPCKRSHQGSWVKIRSRPAEGFRPGSIRKGSGRSLARSNTEARPSPGIKTCCTEVYDLSPQPGGDNKSAREQEHTECCYQYSGVKASCTERYEFSLQEEVAKYSQQESGTENSRTEAEEFSPQAKDNRMRVDEYSHWWRITSAS